MCVRGSRFITLVDDLLDVIVEKNSLTCIYFFKKLMLLEIQEGGELQEVLDTLLLILS